MPRHKELTDPKQVELGRRIREERERQGLTQEKLADAIDVTKQQLSKYETGKDGISVIRLGKLARYLQVDIRTFYEDENHRDPIASIDIDQCLLTEPDVPELLRNWHKLKKSNDTPSYVFCKSWLTHRARSVSSSNTAPFPVSLFSEKWLPVPAI
jgi:transcriptional regulator with XRE-family HTH domain